MMVGSKKQNRPQFFSSFLAALAFAFFGGLGAPVIKLSLAEISVFFLLALRFTLGAALYLVFFARRIVFALRGARLLPLLAVGGLTALGLSCSNLALTLTSATNAGFLSSLSIVFVPFVGWLLFKMRPRAWIYPVIVVVAFGIYLLGGGAAFSFGPGEALLLASSLCAAFVFALSGRFLKDTDWIALPFCQVVIAAVVFWVLAFATRGVDFSAVTKPGVLLAILYLGVCSCFLLYMFQNIALRGLSPTLASLVFSCQSAVSAAGAYFLVGERMGVVGVVGAALIFAGVAVATVLSKRVKTVAG